MIQCDLRVQVIRCGQCFHIDLVIGRVDIQQGTYRKEEITRAQKSSVEFILQHRLFLSDRTGEIISKDFLKLTYPCRWKYDILRALDFFQYAGLERESRMEPALDVLKSKRNKEGTWNAQAAHPGQVHFNMEQAGKPGRWNTLRALRVLKHFETD